MKFYHQKVAGSFVLSAVFWEHKSPGNCISAQWHGAVQDLHSRHLEKMVNIKVELEEQMFVLSIIHIYFLCNIPKGCFFVFVESHTC